MSIDVRRRLHRRTDQIIRLVARLISATLLTGLIGALANTVYERFFDLEAYDAGPPLGRGLFLVVVTLPFILAGLVLLGLPTTYILRRFGAESAWNYALAGTTIGASCSLLFSSSPSLEQIALTAVYGVVCALCWSALRPKS
jgi:hypothetical protein